MCVCEREREREIRTDGEAKMLWKVPLKGSVRVKLLETE